MTRTIFPTTLTLVALSLSLSTLAFTPATTEVDGRVLPEIEWKTTLENLQIDKDAFFGQRFTAMCPSTSQKAGADKDAVYPSTHSICQAGLEAGAIDSKGGLVTVQLNPGGAIHAGGAGTGMARSLSVVVKESSKAIDQIYLDHIQRIKWDTRFTMTGFAYKPLLGQRFTFDCPAAPKNLQSRRVVGTDSYAFASMICRAAVHAGAMTLDGGLVTVQMNPGKQKLVGSVRNGIETKDGSSGLGAISFVANPVNP